MNNTAEFGGLNDKITDAFMTNEDESDELFSDDESKEINNESSISLDASVLRSKTPLSSTDNINAIDRTPSSAVIPSTPLSLVPFLNKINEQWTSDLETPQGNKTVQLHTKPSTNASKHTRETPKLEHTPDILSAKNIDNKIVSNSPVIVTKVPRKHLKRRCIFRSSVSTDTSADISNEYAAVNREGDKEINKGETSFVAENNTNSVAQGSATNMVFIPYIENDGSQVHDRIKEICDIRNNENLNQLRDSVPDTLDLAEKMFNDALFSNIDKSVLNNNDKQATFNTTAQDNSKQNITDTYKEELQTSSLNKVKEKESIGLFTASGTATNVSKQALFKTNAPLADKIQIENYKFSKKSSIKQTDKHLALFSEILLEPQFTECPENYNEMNIKDCEQLFANESSSKKDCELPILQSTVSTVCSNVYEQTSSRVKLPFAKELDESLERNITKRPDIYNRENKLQEIKNPSIVIETARRIPISISKQPLSKAKLLFTKELDESLKGNVAEEADNHNKENRLQEIKNSSMGFQTARGASITISKQALSKAQLLFAKELDEALEPSVTEEVNVNNEAVRGQEINFPSIGFQTARGAPINISEQALSRAKSLFAKELDEPLEPNIVQEADIQDKEVITSNTGFQNARGAPIKISEQALSRAKSLFAKELNEPLESNIVQEADIQDKEVITSNTGFQNARGAPIKISEQALSRAKSLFAKELDESSEYNVTEKIYTNNEAVKAQEIKAPSMGFQTARGASITISKQALSKAKLLFAKELDEPLEPSVTEEVNVNNDVVKGQEINPPSIGFQTVRGAPINISEQALSRAKSLFAKELDEPLEPNIVQEADIQDKEVITSNTGFQNARGAPIKISEQALSRAKSLFAKELDEPLEPNIVQEANIQDKEIITSNTGFQTARGAPINISEQALSKAKSLFAKELDEPLEANIIQETNTQDKEITSPTIGFQTARGTPISISKKALSRAKSLFAKVLDEPLEPNITEKSTIINEVVRGQDTTISSVGFQTARGAAVSISEQAFSEAQTLFTDQLDSPAESNFSEKRKLNSDDSTPLGRGFASGWKKVRLSNEFEGRKLFFDYPSADKNDDKMKTSLEELGTVRRMSTDENDGRIGTELSPEIAASHMEHSNERNQEDPPMNPSLWSPTRDTSELSEPDAMGSPVIGKQPTSRKRWSLEQHRSKHDATRSDQPTLGEASTATALPRENPLAQSKKINEEELQAESQKITQKVESSESADYGDTQMMMDFIDESAQILQNRLKAALEQEETITRKRQHKSKQSVGYLYRLKQTKNRVCLRDLGKGAPLTSRTCQELINQRIPPNILAIIAATAASYKFRCSDFYGNDIARNNVRGLELEDGACLIMDENGYVGVWEFLRAFLASPGVDPNLVPARWIENHYRWIVWKLASMDRMKFGLTELPRALTPSYVMAQLKYRYDREIDRSQRPALRRILEKDDVASKRMILCVSSTVENSTMANSTMEMGKSPRVGMSKWKIELTDGWYSIPACIDLGMEKNVSTGKVREGTKLLIYGAELLNCDVACYPLEAPANVCLKLHTNSTRRARWDSKLGYTSRSGPIPVRLRNVWSNGGFIGKMTIVVARVYPMLYHEKSASGESVFRNAKSEEKAQIEYEQRCRRKAEAFYDKAEEDFQDEDLSCETDLLAARKGSMQKFADKERQDELLRELRMKKERYKQQMQSKLRESLPAPRQVSPLLKVRVCDGNANAILSIWSPGEEVFDALKEGACVSLCNITVAGKRGCELQLTAGRCALFNPGTMSDTSYPPRVCSSFCEIGSAEFSPAYGEFDTVGLVCAVGTAPYGMKDFEVAHLVYPKNDSSRSSSYLSIMFWQGIASYGYAEILTVGSVVACSNLEWRRATSWNVPVAYCIDKSIFTRNPRRNHLYEAFESLRDSIADPVAYAEGCIAELNVELQKKPATMRTPTRYAPDKNSPIKIYNSAPGSDKRPVDHTPLSTSRSTAVNKSWSYTATNFSIQKRLDKLQCYAEPPELSPIVIRSSRKALLDYRSPIFASNASSTDTSSSVNKSGSSNSCLSPEKQ